MAQVALWDYLSSAGIFGAGQARNQYMEGNDYSGAAAPMTPGGNNAFVGSTNIDLGTEAYSAQTGDYSDYGNPQNAKYKEWVLANIPQEWTDQMSTARNAGPNTIALLPNGMLDIPEFFANKDSSLLEDFSPLITILAIAATAGAASGALGAAGAAGSSGITAAEAGLISEAGAGFAATEGALATSQASGIIGGAGTSALDVGAGIPMGDGLTVATGGGLPGSTPGFSLTNTIRDQVIKSVLNGVVSPSAPSTPGAQSGGTNGGGTGGSVPVAPFGAVPWKAASNTLNTRSTGAPVYAQSGLLESYLS